MDEIEKSQSEEINQHDIESVVESSETAFEQEAVDLSLWKPMSYIEDDQAVNDVEEPETKSTVVLSTDVQLINGRIFGVTFLGRGHKRNNSLCQDFHLFKDLGDDWHLFLMSDGAGSASQSHRGAKMNCQLASHLVETLVNERRWKASSALPDETQWSLEFFNICRAIKQMTVEKIDSLDEPVKPRDFNATLMVALVTPNGILCGHIGDGRMGYISAQGQWHSIMTPHKGEEPNQTVFMMNGWDNLQVPLLKMSEAYVPESKIIREKPDAVFLITDGCENAAWNCVQFDETIGKYTDVNTPFIPYWETIIESLVVDGNTDDVITFIDNSSDPSKFEEDDRSLMICIYGKQAAESDNEETVYSV